MKKLLLILLLFPSLAFGYEVEGGSIIGDEVWVSGETYLLQVALTISDGNSLTIQDGAIIKIFNTGIASGRRINVYDTLSVNGTQANPVYWTSCADKSVGADVTDHASCDDVAVTNCDIAVVNIAGATEPSVTINYTEFSYVGGVSSFYMSANPNFTFNMQNSIVRDFQDLACTSNYLIAHNLAPDAGVTTFIFKNNIIHDSYTGDDTSARQMDFGMRYAGTEDIFIIENNLFITESSSDAHFLYLESRDNANVSFTINNNTIVCNNAGHTGTGFYFYTHGTIPNIQISDNIVQGCGAGFNALVFDIPTGKHYNNLAYNNGTDYSATWVKVASEITTTPDFQEHAGTYTPVWADDYHLGVSSNAIDAGSTTATLAGLDGKHATDDGVNDSGTLDLGFHYFTAGAGSAMKPISKFFPISLNPIIGAGTMVIP